ncbi:MAG: pyridoxamine 5'-phosphate oxidase, partial [Burkholderiales bacterium PBB5]
MDSRIADLRKSYERDALDEDAAAALPLTQFETWLQQALAA